MAKTRIIAKSCPKCDQQVAVASKVCKCGYEFFTGKLRSTTSTSISTAKAKDERKIDFRQKLDYHKDERRRTGRVRREKPNFYDSQQFEKKKKRQTRVRLVDLDTETKIIEKKETAVSRAKRRLKKKEESGNDALSKLTDDKKKLAALILAEINRKIAIVQWKP